MVHLPEGHDWKEINVDATHLDFICECGAHFVINLEDESTDLVDDGEGHDNGE